jgi:hypothetical protein
MTRNSRTNSIGLVCRYCDHDVLVHFRPGECFNGCTCREFKKKV